LESAPPPPQPNSQPQAVRFSALTGNGASLIVDANGNVTVSSDERLKNIQNTFDRGLTDLEKINPIVFKWKPETGYDTENSYAGFSAQNIQLAIPEAVGTDAKGFLTLADRPILATVVNAVKEIANLSAGFQEKIIVWLGSATNGIQNIFTKKITTDELCVGTVCVTQTQFLQMIQNSGQTPTAPTQSVNETSNENTSSESSSTATSSTETSASSTSDSNSNVSTNPEENQTNTPAENSNEQTTNPASTDSTIPEQPTSEQVNPSQETIPEIVSESTVQAPADTSGSATESNATQSQ
jgi:hypothetical protein